MPDEEFIEAYTQGRIPRRVFVRRLVVGGLSLAAAMAYGSALAPGAAAATLANAAENRPRRHHNHHNHHSHEDWSRDR